MQTNVDELPSLRLIAQYVAAIRQRDASKLLALRSPDFVLDWVHNDAFADRPLSLEETNRFWQVWFAAFPEMDLEVTRTIAAEDVVVAQWTFTGVHRHPLGPPVFRPPLEPTQRVVRLRGISVYDIADGQITRETMYIDLATLWVELGVSK